jgi:hypothetical protein
MNSNNHGENIQPPKPDPYEEILFHGYTDKDYVSKIFNELSNDYKNTREERQRLNLWEESKDYTILGVIEIFTTDIRGYASQIIAKDSLDNGQEMIENLHKLQILDIPYFLEWYFSSENNYPLLKAYVEKLNYLRLLILEYMSIFA